MNKYFFIGVAVALGMLLLWNRKKACACAATGRDLAARSMGPGAGAGGGAGGVGSSLSSKIAACCGIEAVATQPGATPASPNGNSRIPRDRAVARPGSPALPGSGSNSLTRLPNGALVPYNWTRAGGGTI